MIKGKLEAKLSKKQTLNIMARVQQIALIYFYT